ncbi:putative Mg-chelatase related protein/ATPase [Candidatus Fokinia solitaria]|uniref:Putative Mg-chelatase related protein/ATPase n=1 Tax=Candidatus Fokinia solitaria TaxID=1802984 RepID=A0A2U8BSV7_9RICK|nr:YifB family Mg chelatase-like AAA ATPase [Candidatus Fokinia solitaria]AWD33446.1 putative Mg-chelatase related protein/ATPase [Candidatus Fokinia solitaria]
MQNESIMLSTVKSVAFSGIEVQEIEVQTHIGAGLPCFNIVGLAAKSIAESRDRVRAVFNSIGFGLPAKRITINLAPADIIKSGTHFDLCIALSILVAMEVIAQEEIGNFVILGELSLNGSIRHVNGVLPAAIKATEIGCGVICPSMNIREVSYSGNKNIIVASHIVELVNHLKGRELISNQRYADSYLKEEKSTEHNKDFSDVKGQILAKRGMEIAAAGGHHVLMVGPPGSGKSMLASRLHTIMPPLTVEEQLETTIIASLAGILRPENGLITERPFREPHSSCTTPAMIGGGKDASPGEVTLSHLGILFLDEMPEFGRGTLESLRQPIEAKYVQIARVNNHVAYPAKFQLVGAMNPCKCGYFGSKNVDAICKKAPSCAIDYQNRISGPLLDRFDLQVTMNDEYHSFHSEQREESSCLILQRVIAARELQRERNVRNGRTYLNSELEGELLHDVTKMDEEGEKLFLKIVEKFYFSSRSINKLKKVARTIADLKQSTSRLSKYDLSEALNYRVLNDRKMK